MSHFFNLILLLGIQQKAKRTAILPGLNEPVKEMFSLTSCGIFKAILGAKIAEINVIYDVFLLGNSFGWGAEPRRIEPDLPAYRTHDLGPYQDHAAPTIGSDRLFKTYYSGLHLQPTGLQNDNLNTGQVRWRACRRAGACAGVVPASCRNPYGYLVATTPVMIHSINRPPWVD